MNGLFERFLMSGRPLWPAELSPEDGGAPRDMQVGDVDGEGYVEWKLVPSRVKRIDLIKLESRYRMTLPPLLAAYFLGYAHLFQGGRLPPDGSCFLLPTPTNGPLREFEELLEGWRPLVDAKLIPFAVYGDGYGPICADTSNRDASGDCPVVWIDFEAPAIKDYSKPDDGKRGEPIVFWPSSPPESIPKREQLEPFLQPLFPTIREFFEVVFRNATP